MASKTTKSASERAVGITIMEIKDLIGMLPFAPDESRRFKSEMELNLLRFRLRLEQQRWSVTSIETAMAPARETFEALKTSRCDKNYLDLVRTFASQCEGGGSAGITAGQLAVSRRLLLSAPDDEKRESLESEIKTLEIRLGFERMS
jgi:hypothetical protein